MTGKVAREKAEREQQRPQRKEPSDLEVAGKTIPYTANNHVVLIESNDTMTNT